MTTTVAPFGLRLKAARQRAGLTQEELAARAGLDEFSASARMSQYEKGVHVPRYSIAVQLGRAVGVPVEYLYCGNDELADMLLRWHWATPQQRSAALSVLPAADDKS